MKKNNLIPALFILFIITSNASFVRANNFTPPQYWGDIFGKWQLKNLENSFKKITGRIYVAETEVTNQQYGYYLAYLLEQKDFNTLMTVKADKTDWRKLLPEAYKKLDDKTLFPHGFPDKPTYPAQNMTYEGAVSYCNWLTNFYNNEPLDKRKWKKVLFRLPTEEEWMTAARAGVDKSFMYPWKFNSPRNPKGCFLSNFNCVNEDCKDCKVFDKITKDGALFTTQADAYFPNDFGLYGMIGNVAEMTATQGLAKGGSWEDIPSDCTIQSQKKYTGQSPAVGFRILMEIVE
jgi:formylglycine-generating enzyme required for sulfatase activity